jgi:hypothetical protein
VAAWDVDTGESLVDPDHSGSEATAVALGLVEDAMVVVQGAAGGAISVWAAEHGRRLCGLTLDSGVRCLWFDQVAGSLAVLTADGRLHDIELVEKST